jgi:hypothetical protein
MERLSCELVAYAVLLVSVEWRLSGVKHASKVADEILRALNFGLGEIGPRQIHRRDLQRCLTNLAGQFRKIEYSYKLNVGGENHVEGLRCDLRADKGRLSVSLFNIYMFSDTYLRFLKTDLCIFTLFQYLTGPARVV